MAYEIPYGHPAKMAAGDTLKFKKKLADYAPADGWTMTYYIRGNGTGMVQSYSNDNSTGDFSFYVSKRDTAEWTVGKYRFEGYVYNTNGERYRVDYGDFELTADFQNGVSALDVRSDNEKALDAITATINGSASYAERQFQINGKMIERFSLSELLKAKAYLESEVAKEKKAEATELSEGSSSLINVILYDV
tara:strand:+ start:1771 stop:2346 length:576 start_codon:yes stop_codon:yes gene_type:complete